MPTTDSPTQLGYWINDADNHFTEPADRFERYIDPKDVDLAIRSVPGPDGPIQLFAGIPPSSTPEHVTLSDDELKKLLGDTSNIGVGRSAVPSFETQSDSDEVDSGPSPGACSTGSTRSRG